MLLGERGVHASALREAASALRVPRGPLVQRLLAAARRRLSETDMTPVAAALEVLDEGLRPVEDGGARFPAALTPERVRLVCFQIVSGKETGR